MSLARILGKQKGRQSYIADSRWVLPSCFIGLEFEYEGVENSNLPKHTFADFWAYHEEGSLKNNGAEFVFSVPLFGVDAFNATEWLVSYAKSSKWKCTKRTGIHVHLDVRDLTVPQLAGQTILYSAIEPILYRWIGDGREASHFCIPLYRADEALQAACTIIKSAYVDERLDEHSAIQEAEAFQRYAGYNLQALSKFGSVEFRHMQTTHDLTRVCDWVNMIMSIKAATFRLPHSDGAAIRMLQRMNALELLSYIFPKDLVDKLYTKDSDEELFSLGLPAARDIAVHGCGNTDWVKADFPKGEHTGFTKWLKTYKSTSKTQAYVEDYPEEDEDGEEDLLEQERNAIAQAQADQDQIAQGGIRALGWGDPFGVEGVAAAEAQAAVEVPVPPPQDPLPIPDLFRVNPVDWLGRPPEEARPVRRPQRIQVNPPRRFPGRNR